MATSSVSVQAQIDRATFARLREIVHRNCGISLSEDKITLVTNRLYKRVRDLGLSTYGEYVALLESDRSGDEMTLLLDAVSTNVTYFFREPDHFTFLQQLFDRWLSSGQRRFRVWCAAASTGEEPYTLMMALEDRLGPKVDFRMMATDISTRALAKAMAGVYPERALENIAPDLRRRFLQKVEGSGDDYAIVAELKKRISFRRLNLVQKPLPFHGGLDLILCRNTMIYFEQPLRQQLVDEFERILRPGGYLIVSHSESLVGVKTSLKTEKPSIYVKEA